MNFKNWLKSKPQWLKGGLIGIIIAIFLVKILSFLSDTYPKNDLIMSIVTPLAVLAMPLMRFFDYFRIMDFIHDFRDSLLYSLSIEFFFFGALISSIIKKLKSKVK
jgi:hypothetical protein